MSGEHENMLRQACQGIFSIGVDRQMAAPVAFLERKATSGTFPRARLLPKVLQGIAIAAFVLLAAAERWYWHDPANTVAAKTMTRLDGLRDGQHDFDFYVGKWRVHNRRLLHPLTGPKTWVAFDGTAVARNMWNGRANMDEYEADGPSGHVEGMTVRLYNADTHEWIIYSSDGRAGAFSAPAGVGHFVNGRGEFYKHEAIGGRPVCVRLLWEVRSAKQYHWEQAYSTDEGKTWETNWIIDSNKMEEPAL
jgi:hypothetical protein